MRSPISAALLLGVLGLTATCHAAVTDVWSVPLPAPADTAAFTQRQSALDSVTGLPPELVLAVQFQKAFLRAVGRATPAEWLPQMRTFASAAASDPVAVGLREAAKAWVARAEMEELGKVLDGYYAQNVRYPAAWSEVEKTLPAELRADPWGQPWVYRPHAPQGFAKEGRQRYQLGPTRLPELETLREATMERKPFAPPAWKVALRVVGENRALEFQSGGAVVGLVSAGGQVGNYTLMYVGDRWALLAGPDQLFTIVF